MISVKVNVTVIMPLKYSSNLQAPDYASIIKFPMDLSTMHDKITANVYNSFSEFEVDFKLMCSNAFTYNVDPENYYHKIARRISETGSVILTKFRSMVLDAGFDPDV